MPRMKRPSSSVSTIAISAAVAAGWLARFTVPLPSLMLTRVARQRRDENQARGDGLGEVGDVLADERFLEAELSARSTASRSSSSVWRQSRPTGCSGIVK